MVSATTISVVCPTFNSGRFVGEALRTAFRQTHAPDEVIVSDDGSSDDTPEQVERAIRAYGQGRRSQIIRGPHRGPGAARNAGVKAARGDWIAFLDSDDLWEPEKLQVICEAIAVNPAANFFCHSETHAGRRGNSVLLDYGRKYRAGAPLPMQLYASNLFSTSAVVCKRQLLMDHGLFNERLMSAQDYELWLRLSPFIRPVFVRRALGFYVEREGNITSGRLMARFRNEVRIAVEHRRLVTPWLVGLRLGRIVASYARQYVRRRVGP